MLTIDNASWGICYFKTHCKKIHIGKALLEKKKPNPCLFFPWRLLPITIFFIGMYLAIDKNGVHGTKDPNNPYAEIQVVSIGSDMLAMWGTRANLYLAVDSENGQVYTTSDEGRHCVFIETFTPNFYNIFGSYKSVYDDRAQHMALNSQNKLAMTDLLKQDDRNAQFIWELIDN